MVLPALKRIAQMPDWKAKSQKRGGKLVEFSRLFKTKEYATPDDLFFAIEDLPSFGKEYWFLHFCAPPRKEQVVLTLGRPVEPVKVNNTEVLATEGEQGMACAAVCWLYSNKKEVVFDSSAFVSVKSGKAKSLVAKKGKSQISITGAYPNFQVKLAKDGKQVFSARAYPQKKGVPFEFVHILKNPFAPGLGAAMINYYLDFEGELEGQKLSGKAYLQKVVAVIPLAPWNWVRLHFKGDAALDFFTGKPFGEKTHMHFADNAYLELDGKRTKLRGLRITSYLSGDKRVWILSGKKLFVVMETYALQPFIMKQKTTFRYDEYIVRVQSFAFQGAHKELSLSDLGEGIGLVEEASGYLL
ncbi:MAG: hypothetical protein NT051_00920 [Candidatus Micrarchaeota archaeon]|nr:hypothetical protein [Candidatus Micrarchaeota archaeon]